MRVTRDIQRLGAAAITAAAVLGAAGCNNGQPTATASTPKPALVRMTPTSTTPAKPAVVRTIPLLAAAGDIACPSQQQPAADSCHQAETAQVVSALAPDAVLPLGDLQYETGAIADFNASFDPTWGQFKSRMYPVPGNHEYYTPGAGGYLAYFGSRARPKGTTWYSYNLGTWHLVALDSNCDTVGCEPTSKQVRWLKSDLRANRRRCTLAYWHHPRWTGGKYTDQTQVRTLYSTLYAAGADLILAGHDHGYQRFAKLDPSGHVDTRRGIQTFVVGTGGRSHYPKGRRANLLAANSAVFGVLALRLRPGGWNWRFVPEAGAVFADSGSASCH